VTAVTESRTPGRELYERQIKFLVDKDIDGLIDTNYAPDAELVSFQNVVKGREALRAYFHGYIQMLGDIVVESTDKFAESDDAVFFEATVMSALGRAHVYDAWVLRDGQITHHFTGVMGT
jgi:ketosteroid isomerase-like protein